ncbi:MAG: aspartate aminotransferase family protein [Thermoplasmata archaeon]|nr:aspartate aminotransferase family protein [Thermoplasmata archaeon]
MPSDPSTPRPASTPSVVAGANYVGWRVQAGWAPVEVVRAEGCRFWDAAGHEYLDFASQLVAMNLGFGNRAVAEAIAEQARTVAYVQPGFTTAARTRATEALRAVVPAHLTRFFFSTSGTEANEAALKIARLVTGRRKIIARHRSYHGSTAGSISVSGDLRRESVEGIHTVPGTVFGPECYCYRCPLGLTYPSCDVACVEEIENVLACDPDIAAVIVEPVVGTNGVILPVREYLPRLRAATRRHGALLIADEVMTGWGRTGSWFAVDQFGGEPDILTSAKGITSAYVPLGLTATTEAVYSAFRDKFFPHGHTYEAHPVAMAAAAAAIGEYQRLDLVAKSRRDGEYLLQKLEPLRTSHPIIGDVRGRGLFVAVELVRDRRTREPLGSPADKLGGALLPVDRVVAGLAGRGVYTFGWLNCVLLAPPLIIERSEIDQAVAALDATLRELGPSLLSAPRTAPT